MNATVEHDDITFGMLARLSAKLERELTATQEKLRAAEAQMKDAELLQRKLLVPVKLEPATFIEPGCTIRTVVVGLSAEWRSCAAKESGK